MWYCVEVYRVSIRILRKRKSKLADYRAETKCMAPTGEGAEASNPIESQNRKKTDLPSTLMVVTPSRPDADQALLQVSSRVRSYFSLTDSDDSSSDYSLSGSDSQSNDSVQSYTQAGAKSSNAETVTTVDKVRDESLKYRVSL